MNFINIAGHLGADPEVRYTSSGKKVTTLRVATRARKGGNEDTIWWRVTIWGDQFDKMIPYLKKGSPIVVFGELQKPEIFNDREGKPQISMEITASLIQFSPFGKPEREGAPTSSQAHPMTGAQQSATTEGIPVSPYMKTSPIPASAPHGETFDDEVPF